MNTQTLSALGQAALEYIAKGRRIIPIVPDGKTPMRKGWHENAITTAEEAFAHWSEHPDSNLAFCPEDEGLAIIENDPGGSVASLSLPATYEVQSPRGGTHYYYIGSVPPSASKLGPHIDTRGRTSYVLIPPSVVNGKKYKVKAARDYVALPADIETRLNVRAEVKKAESDVPEDDPRNVAEAKRIIARYKPAIERQGGDNHTFQLCSRLVRDHNLSVDTALKLLEPWNAKCVPPWEPEELRAKLEHARDYGQNEPGSGTPKSASEVFANADVATLVPEAEPPRAKTRFKPIDLVAIQRRPRPAYWDNGRLFIKAEEGSLAIMSGPKGTHKTGVALTTCIGLVFNADARVAYCCAEAPEDVATSRVPAICKHFGKTVNDLAATGRFMFIPTVPRLLDPEDVTALADQMRELKPNVIIIDTTARGLIGQKKNDDAVMTAAAEAGDFLRTHFRALTVMIAHEGKDPERGTKGSSDFEQMADQVIGLKTKGELIVATLKFNRKGADGHSVVYRADKHTEPGKYERVPVLIPTAETAPLQDHPDKLSPEQKDFRHLVCEVLQDLHARDVAARITTEHLARSIFPRVAQRREYTMDEQEREVNKLIKKLQDQSRARGTKPPPLHGLSDLDLPPGARAGEREVRYWFYPAPLGNDPEDDEF